MQKKIYAAAAAVLLIAAVSSCSTVNDILNSLSKSTSQTKSNIADKTTSKVTQSVTTAAAPKASPTVMPTGNYMPADAKVKLQCVVEGKTFFVSDPSIKNQSEMIYGKYTIKDKIVYVDGKATPFSWDGKTLSKGKIVFKMEAPEKNNFSEL